MLQSPPKAVLVNQSAQADFATLATISIVGSTRTTQISLTRTHVKNMYWYSGKSFDTQTIELNIDDPGLLYGATVFTTLRTDNSNYTLKLHYQRLRSSIIDLDWSEPNWANVDRAYEYLTPHFPVLRITIFPDGRELITGRELPSQLTNWQTAGVTVNIAHRDYIRSLPQYKTGNYLAPWLALKQARTQNIQETILTTDRGEWLETSTGNLWGYRDGRWYTPPLSAGILPGIEREEIIDRLHQQVVEIEWEPEWVNSLESIAYSNSVIHLIPIHTVITPTGFGRADAVPDGKAGNRLI
jgi:4-amino-4-deoxychorismate lyase